MILQIFDIFTNEFSLFSTQLTLYRLKNSIGLKKDWNHVRKCQKFAKSSCWPMFSQRNKILQNIPLCISRHLNNNLDVGLWLISFTMLNNDVFPFPQDWWRWIARHRTIDTDPFSSWNFEDLLAKSDLRWICKVVHEQSWTFHIADLRAVVVILIWQKMFR